MAERVTREELAEALRELSVEAEQASAGRMYKTFLVTASENARVLLSRLDAEQNGGDHE